MVNKMIYIYFLIYLLVINFISFFMMYIDKRKAIKGTYRISEKALFISALLLGGIGSYIGMYKFRHKTKHTLFTVGIPVVIVINVFCIYYIIHNNLLTTLFNLFK